jgi:hypothetical protein
MKPLTKDLLLIARGALVLLAVGVAGCELYFRLQVLK